MATILTRLCLAIDSVEDTQASVRFVFAITAVSGAVLLALLAAKHF